MRFGFAFGDRFFVVLFVGLVWLAPAFLDLRFVYALFLWDLLVVLAWLADLATLPRPDQISIKRTWRSPAALSLQAEVAIAIENLSGKSITRRWWTRFRHSSANSRLL